MNLNMNVIRKILQYLLTGRAPCHSFDENINILFDFGITDSIISLFVRSQKIVSPPQSTFHVFKG